MNELLHDTGELVLRDDRGGDPVLDAWRAAAGDAHAAFERWCAAPSSLTYAAYLALADQADAAVATLALSAQQRLPA